LLVASLIFGACHWITPAYAAVASLIGFYLGWLLLATGNLWTPIVAHAFYDFLALVYLVKCKRTGA
jgi:membrane protease YdiL (CAAX protease family)